MTIHEIENLSFAELKASRDKYVSLINTSDKDLATRYVQARIDAKMRDEKLAEQGKTIQNLNALLESERTKSEDLSLRFKTSLEKITSLEQEVERHRVILVERHNDIMKLDQKSAEAESLAKARRAALVDVMQFAAKLNEKVSPLLAQE